MGGKCSPHPFCNNLLEVHEPGEEAGKADQKDCGGKCETLDDDVFHAQAMLKRSERTRSRGTPFDERYDSTPSIIGSGPQMK